jgi:hypothetical protein
VSITVDKAISNAEALLRMEGMHPSPEVLDECRRVLNGEISHEQYITKLREKYMETEHVAVSFHLAIMRKGNHLTHCPAFKAPDASPTLKCIVRFHGKYEPKWEPIQLITQQT